jgi:hypothetical protein
MQPSTHVTHIPEDGVTEPSVLFLVSVAADELTREYVIDIRSFRIVTRVLSVLVYFTGDTRLHVAHHVVELLFLNAGRGEIGATATDGFVRLGKSASKLACRAHIDASPTQPAFLGLQVERCPDTSALAPASKADCLGHHLLFAHTGA